MPRQVELRSIKHSISAMMIMRLSYHAWKVCIHRYEGARFNQNLFSVSQRLLQIKNIRSSQLCLRNDPCIHAWCAILLCYTNRVVFDYVLYIAIHPRPPWLASYLLMLVGLNMPAHNRGSVRLLSKRPDRSTVLSRSPEKDIPLEVQRGKEMGIFYKRETPKRNFQTRTY